MPYKTPGAQVAHQKERYATDPLYREKKLADNRAYNKAHPEKQRAAVDRYRAAHPERVRVQKRKTALRRAYGLTPEQFEAMVEVQKGACAICGSTTARLNVDHDHATGRVRGLLCTHCNHGLGKFGESPDRLRMAIEYLETR